MGWTRGYLLSVHAAGYPTEVLKTPKSRNEQATQTNGKEQRNKGVLCPKLAGIT
jgi:hypothetical protein